MARRRCTSGLCAMSGGHTHTPVTHPSRPNTPPTIALEAGSIKSSPFYHPSPTSATPSPIPAPAHRPCCGLAGQACRQQCTSHHSPSVSPVSSHSTPTPWPRPPPKSLATAHTPAVDHQSRLAANSNRQPERLSRELDHRHSSDEAGLKWLLGRHNPVLGAGLNLGTHNVLHLVPTSRDKAKKQEASSRQGWA